MINKLIIATIIVISPIAIRAQSVSATEVATKIAQKMKDSLNLTNEQRDQIFSINMQLHSQKMTMRQQYNGTDSLGIYLQRVENTRDSLYHTVLNDEKYDLYKQKKRILISNN